MVFSMLMILQVCGGNPGALCRVANWFSMRGDWHAGRLAGLCLL